MNREHDNHTKQEFSDEFLNAFLDNQLTLEEKDRAYLRISQDVDPYRTCKLVIPKTYLHRLHGIAVTGLSRRHPRTARRRS